MIVKAKNSDFRLTIGHLSLETVRKLSFIIGENCSSKYRINRLTTATFLTEVYSHFCLDILDEQK
jgi:hypothetical protein